MVYRQATERAGYLKERMKRIIVETPKKAKLVLIGNGMAGYKFCEKFVKYKLSKKYDLIVFGEEQYPAYDRVNLTNYFIVSSAEELFMAPVSWYAENKIVLRRGEQVIEISRSEKLVKTSNGQTESYDKLIFATGSNPFVPNINGLKLAGVFVYRTIDDLNKIKSYISSAKKALVIGGGILGLEAARALLQKKLSVSVIEISAQLMPRQLDTTAGKILLTSLNNLGLTVLFQKKIVSIEGEQTIKYVKFSDGSQEAADIVIISAGIIPRDELAKNAGLKIGHNGGIVVNDHTLTSDPNIYAIGECAFIGGRIWGLAAPCFEMADVLAARLSGIFKVFSGDVVFSKLKVVETSVVSFGDSIAEFESGESFIQSDEDAGIYRRINISEDKKRLIGGILIGDISGHANFLQIMRNKGRITVSAEELMANLSAASAPKIMELPDNTKICICEDVLKGEILDIIRTNHITRLEAVKQLTRAGTGCESCVCVLEELLHEYLDSKKIPEHE
jgi:nitrite reductase (NADH) large subunit